MERLAHTEKDTLSRIDVAEATVPVGQATASMVAKLLAANLPGETTG
jgi:hypothetical protein